MSYYSSNFSSPPKETPREAVDRIWKQSTKTSDPLLEFVHLLTWCEWSDGWIKEEYEEFNKIATERIREEVSK